jgi:hypothetical protein
MDADVPQPLHRRQVDLIELEVAFDSVSPKMTYYLDLETGQVILVTGEAWRMVEEAAASAGPIQEDDIVFGAHLEEQPTVSASDWMQDVVADAKRIQADTGARYVAIPPRDPHADYHNMQEFVGTVENDSLRERLWDAIQQRGAFRRFRDIRSASAGSNSSENARCSASRTGWPKRVLSLCWKTITSRRPQRRTKNPARSADSSRA